MAALFIRDFYSQQTVFILSASALTVAVEAKDVQKWPSTRLNSEMAESTLIF